MYKYNQIFGVDISKDVFDAMSSQGKHLLFENSSKGFNKFTKHLTKKDLIVMEAMNIFLNSVIVFKFSFKSNFFMIHMSRKLTIMMHISFSITKLKPSTHLRMVSNWAPLELNKMRILEVP